MNDLIATHSYLTEIDFTADASAGDKIYFKDVPTLQPRDGLTQILTLGVDVWTKEFLTATPNGINTIATADAANLTLTLAVESNEYIYNLPVSNLITNNQGGFIRRFNALRVNISKSYVTVVKSGVILKDSAIAINFYYLIKTSVPGQQREPVKTIKNR